MNRVRFAPSPTGYLHLGNVRTALFNYLFAKSTGGTILLRVEDTDAERSKKEFLESQKEDLRWLGIDWDEGPDVGGPFGPYKQSERLELYREAIQKLIVSGNAYECYVTEAEMEEMKQAALREKRPMHFDNRGRNFSASEIESRKKQGVRPTVRFKIDHPNLELEDWIRGKVVFNLDDMVGDFVIQRADGMPTFHLAVVVDDAMMKITHVIRGEDHLSNTPKHILLQRALGYPTPQYAHLSLVHGPGGEPLSKRLSSVSVREFRKLGYLPHALANYIALLGWAPPDAKREILPWQELQNVFDLKKVSRSSSNFDPDKLDWVNGEHLRQLSSEDFARRAKQFLESGEKLPYDSDAVVRLLPALQDNIRKFEDLKSRVSILDDSFDYEDPQLLKQGVAPAIIKEGLQLLESATDVPAFDVWTNQIKEKVGAKGKDLFHPIRLAITGRLSGPEMKRIFPLLDRDLLIRRLRRSLSLMV